MSEENVIQLDLGTTAQKTTAAEKLPVVYELISTIIGLSDKTCEHNSTNE